MPQVLKCQFIILQAAGASAFVHVYLRYNGTAPSSTDLNNVAGALSTAWNTNYAPLCSVNYSLTNVNVTDLTSPTSAQGTNAVVHPGTRTGVGLTANDCMLVNQKIARRYRGGKPRQYWPLGVSSDLGNDFVWISAFLTSANTALTGFNNALLAVTWAGATITQIVNVSYFQNFTVKTNPITGRARNVPTLRPTPVIDPVTNHTINSRVATQRRRQHFSA